MICRGGPFDGRIVEAYNCGSMWHGQHEGVNVFYLLSWREPLRLNGERVLDYWMTAAR